MKLRKLAPLAGAFAVILSMTACSGSPQETESAPITNLEIVCLEPTIEGDEDTGAIAFFDLNTEGDKKEVVARAKDETVEALTQAIGECPTYTFADVVINAATTSSDDKPVVSLRFERADLESGIPGADSIWESASESTVHDDLK